jgi:hypothetical protein
MARAAGPISASTLMAALRSLLQVASDLFNAS